MRGLRFIFLFVSGRTFWGPRYILAITRCTAMNIRVQVSVFRCVLMSLAYIPRSRTAVSAIIPH